MLIPKEFTMIIAVGADDGFAMPMAVTLYSALANLEQDRAVSLYIIDCGISEQNRHRLTEVLTVKYTRVQIKWVRPDLSQLKGLKPTAWYTSSIPQATYPGIVAYTMRASNLLGQRSSGGERLGTAMGTTN
jgi:lipopolysaccharide biosynthesis glycosyltransferase